VGKLEAGQPDADLGGHVYKQRIPPPSRKRDLGEGKSGGYRVIVFFKSGDKTFFQYGFPKSERDNISKKELRYYKEMAKDYLSITGDRLNLALKAGKFIEI
jgi:hypothetical protein